MAEDNFIRWYKKNATQLAKDVPDEVWNSIETELDLNEVWNGIENELDVNDVWSALSNKLDGAPQPAWQKPVSYALMFSLLIFLFNPKTSTRSPFLPSNKIAQQQVTDCVDSPVTSAVTSIPKGDAVKVNATSRKNIVFADHDTPFSSVTQQSQTHNGYPLSSTHENPLSDVRKVKLDRSFMLTQSAELLLPTKLSDDEEKQQETSTEPEAEKEEKPRARQFYVDIHGSYKNTWLLSEKTFYNLDARSQNDTEITYGKEFGATVGYFVRPRLVAQFSINYSEDGQRYYEYIQARHTPTAINLRYTEMALSARLIQRRSFLFPQSVTSVTGGFFYGIMSGNSHELNITPRPIIGYRKCNVGLTGALEQEVKLSDRWAVSGSLQFKYGLINIYEGTETRPKFLNETRTASVGVQLGLRHYLSKK